jgi:hypothetical protein
LGSALRIAAIRRQVLRGVPFVPVPMPAGAPDFGAGASFYRMQTADSPEWTQVLRDDSLAVYPPPSSRAARFSLYWT